MQNIQENKVTKRSSEQDIKYKTQEAIGLDKAFVEFTELSAVNEYWDGHGSGLDPEGVGPRKGYGMGKGKGKGKGKGTDGSCKGKGKGKGGRVGNAKGGVQTYATSSLAADCEELAICVAVSGFRAAQSSTLTPNPHPTPAPAPLTLLPWGL